MVGWLTHPSSNMKDFRNNKCCSGKDHSNNAWFGNPIASVLFFSEDGTCSAEDMTAGKRSTQIHKPILLGACHDDTPNDEAKSGQVVVLYKRGGIN